MSHKIFKKLLIFFVTVFAVATQDSYAQTQERDSTVVFSFKVGKDTFWYDYKDNQKELGRLANFLQGNRAKIMRGHKKIYVDGYCNTLENDKKNYEMARKRSSHVKSYMVLMFGFQEEAFKTQNHIDTLMTKSDIVEVSFILPKVEEKKLKPVERAKVDSIVVREKVVEQSMVKKKIIEPEVKYLNKELPVNNLDFESAKHYTLLEQGVFYTSLYADFTNSTTLNMLVEPFFDVKNIFSRNVSVQAAFGYFVQKNVAVGAYAGYKMSDIRVQVMSDILQLLINSRTYDTKNVSTGFNVGVFTKNFIPLEYKQRIFLVNEASLYYNYMKSLSRNVYDNGALLSKVEQNTHSVGIKLSLGVQYFLCPGLSMEFNISPIAAFYQYNSVLNNETLQGKFSGGSINTIVMPIDMKFGLTYFFGLDYKKNNKFIKDYMHRGMSN